MNFQSKFESTRFVRNECNCFVIANVIRDNSIVFYYLLVLGLGLFVLGLTTKKKQNN
jgi:hypothetical protein